MSVLLSETSQHQIEQELQKDGVITEDKLELYKGKAEKEHKPLFTLLIEEKAITDEQFTKASAIVNKIPYVNLTEAPPISQKVCRRLIF
jgi:hypothetical protein